MRPSDFLQRWRRTSWRDRALLAEALLLLALARIVIMALPFRIVGRIAGWFANPAPLTSEMRRSAIRRVRWAIRAAARRAPFRAVCFQQGLAAQIMLRRRGVASTLYFGAAPDDAAALTAHVWVRDVGTDVVGCENAQRFAVLISFPAPCKTQAEAA